jgi:hypothetical protein
MALKLRFVVEALCYKPGGHVFDSRFSMDPFLRAPDADSSSYRNE